MSKQFAISSAASIFAMACFALLSPDSAQLQELRGDASLSAPIQVEMPELEMPVPELPVLTR